MGDAESPANTAEAALNVERYVLPKCKVAIDFTSKDNKPKRDYRPGEHVTGTVRANYFFGRPVDGSEVTPEMAGTLDVNAYVFGRDARPIGDHRLVFVQPADELKIETTVDAPAYKPGDDARIRFCVTNSRGQGVSAAIGLQVVDEAVFALAQWRCRLTEAAQVSPARLLAHMHHLQQTALNTHMALCHSSRPV